MATAYSAVKWIQAQMRALEGVRKAYDSPPDKTVADLVAVAFVADGAIRPGAPAGARTDYHNVTVQLHVPLKNLARDYDRLIPYIEKAAAVITDDITWGGNVETIRANDQDIGYQLGPDTWAGQAIVRLRFVVSIKIVQT